MSFDLTESNYGVKKSTSSENELKRPGPDNN